MPDAKRLYIDMASGASSCLFRPSVVYRVSIPMNIAYSSLGGSERK